ncbi:hypothetical protein [Frankia sp. Cppng1_Ct_nod]|uniref:hypothetical protein n=1 Tax=Frankia sp. Cppng1_Ct_nod TaxID=2897162 RepID=UPI00104173F7|nr:hypothetical protein [Frankia sp. Cppng1_Ct_nod]
MAAGLATGANAVTPAAADTDTGSVTISLTEPVAIIGTADTTVSCTAGRLTYQASASTVPIKSYTVSFTVVAAPYHGPGTYTGLLTLQLTEPDGTVITLPAAAAPTTVTGGSFTIDLTAPGGIPVDGSLAWVCSA